MYEINDLKGPVQRVEQRKRWAIDLDHLPEMGAFDIEFSRSGKILRETHYFGNGAVYDSSHFFFDEAERLIRTVRYDKRGIAVAFSDAEYVDGNCVWTMRDAEGVVIAWNIEVYGGNRLLRLESYDGFGQIRRLKHFHYWEGRLRSAVSDYYMPGRIIERAISVYDDLGRIAETFGLNPDGEPNGDGRYVYQYDEQGRTLRILSYNDFADEGNDFDEGPNSVRGFVYECDDRGNWIERTEHFRFSGDLDWTTHTTIRRISYYSPL